MHAHVYMFCAHSQTPQPLTQYILYTVKQTYIITGHSKKKIFFFLIHRNEPSHLQTLITHSSKETHTNQSLPIGHTHSIL